MDMAKDNEYLKKRGEVWHLDVTLTNLDDDPGGHRIRLSLDTKDDAVAMAFRDKYILP